MAVLGYLPKFKRGLELAFGAHFLHDSSTKSFNVIYFFLLKISNKMCYLVLIWTIDDVLNFKIYLQSTSKAMADSEKKMKRWK